MSLLILGAGELVGDRALLLHDAAVTRASANAGVAAGAVQRLAVISRSAGGTTVLALPKGFVVFELPPAARAAATVRAQAKAHLLARRLQVGEARGSLVAVVWLLEVYSRERRKALL